MKVFNTLADLQAAPLKADSKQLVQTKGKLSIGDGLGETYYITTGTPDNESSFGLVNGNIAIIYTTSNKGFSKSLTLAEAVSSKLAKEGDTVTISDRGNGLFEYKSGQVANTFNIVACEGVPTLSLVLDTSKQILLDAMVSDAGANADVAVSAWLLHPQKNKVVMGDFLVSNISEAVNNANIYGGGSIKSESGSSGVLTLTGSGNKINNVTIGSELAQNAQAGLLALVGDSNRVKGCTIGWDSFVNPTVEGQQYGAHAVSLSGNNNRVVGNNISNVNTGVADSGYYNTISNNIIDTACRGVELRNKSRHAKVAGNNIDLKYSGQGLGGCDGVWGNRNHRYSIITGNTILNAGEHGTYLQGDSFVVSGNTVKDCRQSGIKVGAKTSGNYWYAGETVEELAPNGDYTGFDIVIDNNVCEGNEKIGGTTAEIYIQPNAMDVIISNNVIRNGGSHGIRTVFFSGGTANEVMKGITITGNKIKNTVNASILCASSDTALITENDVDGTIQTDSRDGAEPMLNGKISDNKCTDILISRASNAIVKDNIAESVFIVTNSASLINNTFTNQENGDFNDRAVIIRGNRITYNGLISTGGVSLQGCDNVESNEFIFLDATAAYPLDVDFNSGTPSRGMFANNEVHAVNTSRPVRIGGSNSAINGNKVYNNGTNDFAFGVYADDCVLSGNVLSAGSIRLESGSSGNIVSANAALITDSGTGNILGTNRV